MPGRYSFQSRFGRPEDGWFTIGSLQVNTTIGIVGLGVIGMLLGAVPRLRNALDLTYDTLGGFEVWRLATYIVPNEMSIWTLILLYMVYTFGSQLENQMGREAMLRLVIALSIVPAIVFAVLVLFVDSGASYSGLNVVELGLLVAFAAQFPWVRFFFGIPAPVMVGIFVLLQVVFAGSWPALALVLVTVLLALFGMRAMGYAGDVHQIPRLSIPGLTPATSLSKKSPRQSASPKRRQAKSEKNKVVRLSPPGPSTSRTESPPAEIDAILDQINESGIDSLSADQRATLDEYSKRLRNKRDS